MCHVERAKSLFKKEEHVDLVEEVPEHHETALAEDVCDDDQVSKGLLDNILNPMSKEEGTPTDKDD